MTARSASQFRRGISLIEIAAVLALLGVVLTLIAVTLLGIIRIERADAAAFHKMLEHASLTDQFRSDVAEAVDAPAKWRKFAEGPTCLILRRADDSHVVYGCADGGLQRTEFTGSGTAAQVIPAGDPETRVSFGRADGEPNLLILKLEHPGPATHLPLEIAAALGGNWR